MGTQILIKPMNETEQIERVLRGDMNAFSELVRLHQDKVFAMIMRQVGDRTVAEDISQETFVRAYKYLKNFRGESSLSTWLTRIAINQCHTYFASKKYRQKIKTNSLKKEHIENLEAPEANKIDSQVEALKKQVGKLKPKLREVVVLISFEGHSYEEAADILGIPSGTVASRMNAAFKNLREVYLD